LQIPADVAKDRSRLSKVIAAFKEAIEFYRSKKDRSEAQKVFEKALEGLLTNIEFSILRTTLNDILSLIDKGRDSIWIYMLSNMYMPIALSESKFDVIVGNPPWIAMRYIENKEYQDFVKRQVFAYKLLDKEQVHLFSNMEVATLFFCRVSDLYLKEGGIIGFVMPRSVLTGAMHHMKFKEFRKPSMTLHKILDLEDVSPLFNVPSCVLIAIKGGTTRYPVSAMSFSGKLPEKNLRLHEVYQHLSPRYYHYNPPMIQYEKSLYYKDIKDGASLIPRNLWFIEFDVHPTLGIDLRKPFVKTSRESIQNAKAPWDKVRLEGNVEADFIYATLLGGDIIPFGYVTLRPVVLPIKLHQNKYALLDVGALRNEGFTLMASWLERAQRMWEEHATERALKDYPRVIGWINYMNKLTNQDPKKRYVLLYNASGTNLVSCVIDKQLLQGFRVGATEVKPRGFVAESKTYFYETNDENEAHYLCAILNSPIINDLIKPLQTRGLFGERDIQRRPFMFPIPKFSPQNPTHLRLADMSKVCHRKIVKATFKSKSVAGKRKEAMEIIKGELEEINKLVSQLLNLV